MDASSAFKDTLPTSPETLMAHLREKGVEYTLHEHPPLRTVEDSKAYRKGMDGAHVKNLYLRDRKKRNFLLIVPEDQPVDLKSLPETIRSDRLSFGSADRLFEFLGVRPGAVSLFALINDPDHRISLVLDASLLNAGAVFFHPLVNDLTLGISPEGMRTFLALTGHHTQFVAL